MPNQSTADHAPVNPSIHPADLLRPTAAPLPNGYGDADVPDGDGDEDRLDLLSADLAWHAANPADPDAWHDQDLPMSCGYTEFDSTLGTIFDPWDAWERERYETSEIDRHVRRRSRAILVSAEEEHKLWGR